MDNFLKTTDLVALLWVLGVIDVHMYEETIDNISITRWHSDGGR
jgi:hypothetical protein